MATIRNCNTIPPPRKACISLRIDYTALALRHLPAAHSPLPLRHPACGAFTLPSGTRRIYPSHSDHFCAMVIEIIPTFANATTSTWQVPYAVGGRLRSGHVNIFIVVFFVFAFALFRILFGVLFRVPFIVVFSIGRRSASNSTIHSR
jgi:hypothetical protein